MSKQEEPGNPVARGDWLSWVGGRNALLYGRLRDDEADVPSEYQVTPTRGECGSEQGGTSAFSWLPHSGVVLS